jgi:hypothetical protein
VTRTISAWIPQLGSPHVESGSTREGAGADNLSGMVDPFASRLLGSIVICAGIGMILISRPHARRHADYLRSGQQKPRPFRVFPYDRPEYEPIVRWQMFGTGVFITIVGALWVARIG